MARLRLPYFALCLGVIVILGGGALHLLAVTSCVPPDVLTPNYAFKIGAAISVTASNFPPALQPCVQKAFDNWNAANDKTNPSGNFSGVKFTVTYGSPVSTTNQVLKSQTGPHLAIRVLHRVRQTLPERLASMPILP